MVKEHYARHLSEYSWLIKEEGWVRSLQGVREAQFALGNGLLGSRSVLEEIPYDAKPGTYIAGFYDSIGSQVAELVNLPNPFNFKIAVEGEKLGVVTMDVLKHKRALNLRHGLLLRHSIFQDTKKRRYDYQSLRFLSADNKNIGVMQIVFTPLDDAAHISIETGIETSVYNDGTATEGRKRHFRVKELGQFKNEGYLIVETFDKRHAAVFRSGFYYQTKGKKVAAKDNIFELELAKRQTIVFTKIFCIENASKNGKDLEKAKALSEGKFRKAFSSSFPNLLTKHIAGWESLWDRAEISIWGDPELEKNIRFNIYHLLTSALKNNGSSSIPAKALSGEAYRGHIFWDAEIYMLPFYIFTLPEAARNMLLYRYRRLDAARENARELGYKGAMFPWESADTGKDETPSRARDLDGKVIRIHTGELEHHITADIAYALYYYYNATQDEKFMRDCGYEILFETARFWASRVEYNKKHDKYEIKHVIGPDEFHIDVNNNAFTNILAKWNLLTAHKMSQQLKKTNASMYKKIAGNISLSAREAAEWKKIANRIVINMYKNLIIEQFDGYFRKRKIKFRGFDENHIPIITEKMTPRDYSKTQLIKQADVVIALYLFSDVFGLKTKRKNYDYYLERTMHKSSLSLSAYALMAAEVGDIGKAYRFFHTSAHTDISNINGNTHDGVHAACIGGTWQTLVNGFAGVRIEKDTLSINPKLPRAWRKILFKLSWRGELLKLELNNSDVKIRVLSPGKRKKIKVKVFGTLRNLGGKKTFNFKRTKAEKEKEAYYL